MNARTRRFDIGGVLATPFIAGTVVLSLVSWFIAFIGQVVVEAKFRSVASDNSGSAVGIAWFAIFFQLGVIAWIVITLGSGTIAYHRMQIGILLAVALTFAVLSTSESIYGQLQNARASRAMGVGYLFLSMIDLIWLIAFTSDEETAAHGIFFGSRGGGGASGRRTPAGGVGGGISRPRAYEAPGESTITGAPYGGNGVANGGNVMTYGNGGAIGAKRGSDRASMRSAASQHSLVNNAATGAGGEPLMSSTTHDDVPPPKRAKALYDYTANKDDPSEVSFRKGEMFDVLDDSGKWFNIRKANGESGIAPSNYLARL